MRSEWHNHDGTIETYYAPDGHIVAVMNNIGDTVKADGDLIAAAPDMHEALKEIIQFKYLVDTNLGIQIRKALKKAGGK